MAMVFEESPVRLRQVYINLFQNANILEEKNNAAPSCWISPYI